MAATFVDSTTQVDLASTACTIAVPTHSEGDLLIALCLANAASPPGEWTRPVGWTETGGNQTGDSLLQMCTKIASGSEPVDYEWTHNFSGDLCIIMLSYSGAALTSPSDHFSDQGSVYTCPTAESDNDDQVVLRWYGSIGDTTETITVPAATTERAEIEQSALWSAVGEQTQATAGSTGTEAFTTSGTGTDRICLTYVITNAGWEAVARPSAFMLFVD